jgi:hypothetical protein
MTNGSGESFAAPVTQLMAVRPARRALEDGEWGKNPPASDDANARISLQESRM